ncbi:helix-turn-helix domain-containing protein [Streptomyces filamentosus]|uniref:helix-turn-helix domain-containing protein n=1 Tax=Streptomyces filamentosus TaxID=67294 RepID=UPI0033C1041F
MTTTNAPAGLKTSEQKALAALTEHSGATAAQIAAYAGIGGSTAGKALNTLEGYNLAYRERGAMTGSRKEADLWYHRPVETTPEHISDEAETEAAPEATEAAPETEAEAPAEEAHEAPAAAETPAPAAKTPAAKATPAKRLARGDLRQMVYDHLAAHPAEEIGPSGLGKLLGRSAGAVANALAKLTAHGQAELTSDSPRRYRFKA